MFMHGHVHDNKRTQHVSGIHPIRKLQLCILMQNDPKMRVQFQIWDPVMDAC